MKKRGTDLIVCLEGMDGLRVASRSILMGQPLRYGKPGFENPHFVVVGAR